MDLEVDPKHKLRELGELLKEAPRSLNREVSKGLAETAEPVEKEIRSSTDEFLPERGGLAKRVARTRFSRRVNKGKNPKVTVKANPSHDTLRDPLRADRGRIAHPVFGMAHSRNPWQLQDVKPGWFSQPAEDSAPLVRRELIEAIDGFIEQVERQI